MTPSPSSWRASGRRSTSSGSRATRPTSSTSSTRSWSPTGEPSRFGPASPTGGASRAPTEAWLNARGIPTVGRIEAPGTIEGGDTFWLRPDLLCIGRTLRTNAEGARQLDAIVRATSACSTSRSGTGPAELIHLLSVISPVADDLAVVYLPLLPVGLWELLGDFGIGLIAVPDDEFPTLGCNVLAVRPGVVIMAEGNPHTAAALARAGCEVHTYPATRDRDQRLRRPDLPDPADPAREPSL